MRVAPSSCRNALANECAVYCHDEAVLPCAYCTTQETTPPKQVKPAGLMPCRPKRGTQEGQTDRRHSADWSNRQITPWGSCSRGTPPTSGNASVVGWKREGMPSMPPPLKSSCKRGLRSNYSKHHRSFKVARFCHRICELCQRKRGFLQQCCLPSS